MLLRDLPPPAPSEPPPLLPLAVAAAQPALWQVEQGQFQRTNWFNDFHPKCRRCDPDNERNLGGRGEGGCLHIPQENNPTQKVYGAWRVESCDIGARRVNPETGEDPYGPLVVTAENTDFQRASTSDLGGSRLRLHGQIARVHPDGTERLLAARRLLRHWRDGRLGPRHARAGQQPPVHPHRRRRVHSRGQLAAAPVDMNVLRGRWVVPKYYCRHGIANDELFTDGTDSQMPSVYYPSPPKECCNPYKVAACQEDSGGPAGPLRTDQT